jgi:hypothetical protein
MGMLAVGMTWYKYYLTLLKRSTTGLSLIDGDLSQSLSSDLGSRSSPTTGIIHGTLNVDTVSLGLQQTQALIIDKTAA